MISLDQQALKSAFSLKAAACVSLCGRCLCAGLAIILLAACSRTHRIYPEITSNEHAIRTVAIIPLTVSLRNQGIGSIVGSDPASQKAFRHSLTESLQAALRSHGIESVAPFENPASDHAGEQALPRSTIAEVAFERTKALADISFTDERGFLRTRTLNPPVDSVLSEAMHEMASFLKVDGVILISSWAVELSPADYALEIVRSTLITLATAFVGGTRPHRTFLSGDLMVVDGKSSRVLFFNSIEDSSADPDNREELLEFMEELIAPLMKSLRRGNSSL